MNNNIGPLPNKKKYKHFLQTRKNSQALYLGINTNIKCFNNICPSEKQDWFIEYLLDNKLDEFYNPKFGIYLGKIIFNKKGNKLIPEYIPTSIENLEEEIIKIKNPLWIAEKNGDYVEPKITSTTEGQSYRITSPKNLEYQCKIEKNTTVLNQEQILSYVNKIHSENVKIIQDYIEQIYKDNGIKPYAFDDELYEELGSLEIITQRQVEGFKNDRLIKKNSLLLVMLDYLARQDRKNKDYLITFDDEYFYDYFVFSLGGFILKLSQGMLQNEINSLFNPAAYIDDTKIHYNKLNDELSKKYEKEIFNMGFEKRGNYFVDYFDYSFNYNGFFEINKYNGSYYDELNLASSLDSPNIICYDKSSIKKCILSPSTLGKYYFQISRYHEEVFFELLRPYYPNMKNLPKGWNKEMIEKI
ncbi:hypothetical protein [Campylobacter subantarcticus]|uniref:Uncharacterized protein n=1 Tax=Campylobacter subantarcticus LMG 24374 TaxID=1388751 RepID=A0A0A8H9X5_9BACT|nr:hypothetical protein [Campylobacter subantarcticus]AJC90876.1 hypothetical protein CSUB8521_1040 [Campylobacter subantarcticus LMG 24374]EAJ1260357.1 hypothetical protein [Campylobacter lari]